MIIRGVPINIDNFIKVDASGTEQIRQAGYLPRYFDGKFSYFAKTNEFLAMYQNFLNKGGDLTK